MIPVEMVFYTIVDEMGEWVLWLHQWNLFGVPFIYYIIGISIMYILFDRIF